MNNKNNFIGERVTTLRLAKGISEYSLSKNIGKCNNYINKVSSGTITPTIPTLSLICDFFGITLSQFFQDESTYVSPVAAQVASRLPALNEEQLQSLLVIIQSMEVSGKPEDKPSGRPDKSTKKRRKN